MNYEETINYLFTKLPMFQRQGNEAMRKYNLEGITKLCDYLGNPERKLVSIHVAGTNGKGSTSSMIASIFQSMGYNVGLYTTPHLSDFSERIRLNGVPIPFNDVIEFTEKIKPFIEKENPSFFEVSTAMAFDYFSRTADISIIEVGMGGRYDSTNIIDPIASIITQINYDHTEFLGDNLANIASEKAGIIKKNIPVIISTTQSETTDVFLQKAIDESASISFGDQIFTCYRQNIQLYQQILSFKSISSGLQTFPTEFEIETDLTGKYQVKNIFGVLAFVEVYNSTKSYNKTNIKKSINFSDVCNGLKNVKINTGFRGRMDILSKSPLVIADVAHNPDGVKALFEHLNELQIYPTRFILGVVREKDLNSILPFFPKKATYYFVKPNIPRGLDAQDLKKKAEEYGLVGKAYSSVEAGIDAAINDSKNIDSIVTTGSIFTVAEVLSFFETKNHHDRN